MVNSDSIVDRERLRHRLLICDPNPNLNYPRRMVCSLLGKRCLQQCYAEPPHFCRPGKNACEAQFAAVSCVEQGKTLEKWSIWNVSRSPFG